MAKHETTIKRLNPKGAETKYVGFEPEWRIQPDESNRISSFANAFQWYNYHYGKKDAKDMIAQYLEINHRKADAKLIRGIPDSQIRLTPAWVCRMSVMGLMLNEHEQCILDEQISLMLKSKQEVKKAAATEEETVQVKLTIQDHLREKASECAGELEGMFDDFIVAGAKMSADFKPIALIRGMNISPQMIPNITRVWDLRLQEFSEVLEGSDEQLLEGYSHLSKAQLKQCVKFCETVLSDCSSYISIKKVERKPRAKKLVSPETQARKFKYLKEFSELNLKSENPAKLVNASEAWLYDTAKRKLIHVLADSHLGTFTIKGSSIIAFDATTSVQKTLRKPAEQIKNIMSGGKPAMRKSFGDIKATETKFTGRGNENIIILKAW
ncbi:MAG: hypothetical protein EB127_04415 [Alphaproteobacteria bacterium]|nr:hypothetical protein [Alphaproteobacteria bacterium]